MNIFRATDPTHRNRGRGCGPATLITLIGAVLGSIGGATGRFEIVGLGIVMMLLGHLRQVPRWLHVRGRTSPRASDPTASASDLIGRWNWDLDTGIGNGDLRFATMCDVAELEGEWTFEAFLHRVVPSDLNTLHGALENALEGDHALDVVVELQGDHDASHAVRLLGRVENRGDRPASMQGVSIVDTRGPRTEDLADQTNSALERSLAEQANINDELIEIRRHLESQNRELDRARGAAVEATRYKSEFLANMSHEIRTPLSSIIGFADLLEEDGDREQRADMLLAIRRNSEHLLSLVNDVLDLSRIEAGRVELERIPTRIVDVTEDVVQMLRSRADQKGLALVLEFGDELPAQVSLDPTRFRQILINLVGNAIKFTEDGGIVVRVDHHASTNRLEVSISDTGIGLDERAIRRIFQPFRQGDGSTTRRYGGTGLGLHISRRLCELFGGSLTVESSPDKGSTFTAGFLAPAIQGNASLIGLATDAPPVGLRVLLAEDGPDNRVLIEHLLGRLGAQTVAVENGREAVDRVLDGSATFDVLILDMQMPIMDGWEAARQLRNVGSEIAILALTANALPGDRKTCLEAGCDGFLTKPVRRQELASGLVEVLAASQNRRGPIRVAG